MTKDLRVIPDKSTYKSHFADNTGIVFCRLFNTDGTNFHACPRYLLETALAKLKNLGFDLKIGYELEFQLLNPETLKPVE